MGVSVARFRGGVWRKSDIRVSRLVAVAAVLPDVFSAAVGRMRGVGSLSRWNINRQLKSTTAALKHAEGELRIEREQLLSYRDDAADAVSYSVFDGNAADRDEAFRAQRHLERSGGSVQKLETRITELRLEQDRLLDRLSSGQ
jgi:hypothetical protein